LALSAVSGAGAKARRTVVLTGRERLKVANDHHDERFDMWVLKQSQFETFEAERDRSKSDCNAARPAAALLRT